MSNMTNKYLDCLRQIAETAALLGQQFGNLADIIQEDIALSEKDSINNSDSNDPSQSTQNGMQQISEKISYPLMYFGAPSGNGFEESSQLQPSSVKCLYIIQKTSETTAIFYPLIEKLSRFKMNPNSLFSLVCTAIGDISDSSSMEFTEDDYGELEYSEGYWKVMKKCNVFFT